MILGLLALSAGVSVTVGAVAAYLVRRKQRSTPTPPTQAAKPAAPTSTKKPSKHSKKAPAAAIAAGAGPRGLRIADVVLYADTELWLAGVLHLEEDGFVMRVFRTPGSPRADWLVQLDEAAEDVALCGVTSEVPRGVVPEALPMGGQRLVLRRRGQARVRAEGSEIPRDVYHSRYIELRGAGGRTLVVLDFENGERLALLGDRVGRELLELLPGGDLERDPNDA